MKAHRSAVLWSAVVLLAASSVLITACGKKSNPMSPVTGADVTITITGINGSLSFIPNPATAKVGQTVAWHNTGGAIHTATDDGSAFNTGDITNGSTSVPIAMGTAGSFGYRCAHHSSMVGTLNVNP